MKKLSLIIGLIIYAGFTHVDASKAQFTSFYINQEFGYYGAESGKIPYQWRDTLYFKLNFNKLILTRMPKGRLRVNDTGLVTSDSVQWAEISGKPSIPSQIDTTSLSNRINSKQNQLNGTGFVKSSGTTISYDNSTYLTGITSGQVTTALGFTPYNSTNPSNYINQAGARSAISLTTTGSGVSTYNSSTGALNIPDYTTTVPLRDKSGVLTNAPVFFTDTFTIASATPTISLATYLSASGKTSFKLTSCDAYRLSATTSNIPTIVPTALSSNSVTFLLTQTNTATITILGINVLNGLPVVNVPDPQNVKVILSAYFY